MRLVQFRRTPQKLLTARRMNIDKGWDGTREQPSCAQCHGQINGPLVDLTKPYLSFEPPSPEQLAIASAIAGAPPSQWSRPLGESASYIFTGRPNPSPEEFMAALAGFGNQSKIQISCYLCCMKSAGLIALGVGGGGGWLVNRGFPKIPSLIPPSMHGAYITASTPKGSIRSILSSAVSAAGEALGISGENNLVYKFLRGGRGANLVRGGAPKWWAYGGRSGFIALLLASIFCSGKCGVHGWNHPGDNGDS